MFAKQTDTSALISIISGHWTGILSLTT